MSDVKPGEYSTTIDGTRSGYRDMLRQKLSDGK